MSAAVVGPLSRSPDEAVGTVRDHRALVPSGPVCDAYERWGVHFIRKDEAMTYDWDQVADFCVPDGTAAGVVLREVWP